MSEAAVASPPVTPEPSFDDFLTASIGTGLEQEQLETLQAKHPVTEAPTKVEPPAPAEAPVVAAPTKPAEPPKKADWEDALEFSKDLDKTPVEPKTAAEKYTEKPPGPATEKASNAWAALRHRATQADALEKANVEMAAKLKTLEEQTQGLADKEIVPKELWAKSIKDQEELAASLKISNLEATPEFRQVITQPMAQIRDAAKVLAERYHVPLRDVLSALEEPDESKQADMLSDLAETGQFKEKNKLDLFRYGDQMRDLQAKRTKLNEDVGKTLLVIENQRKIAIEKQQQMFQANWNQALTKSWDTLEKGIWMFKKSDTDQEWNQSLDSLKETVRSVNYNALPMEKQAQILYQAAMIPRVLKALVQAKEIITSQETALKKYGATTPGSAAGGSDSNGSAPVPSGINDGRGFVEAML